MRPQSSRAQSALRASSLTRRSKTCLPIEPLEHRRLMSTTIESADGSGNNLADTAWGSAGSDLLRLVAAAYTNGINSPSLANDLSARAISNILNNQADPTTGQDIATIDKNSLSDYGYAFGQFMDHDLDLTPDGGAAFNIAVAAGDPIGPQAMPFTRSQTDPTTGTSTSNPLQQVTTVTSYFDLSQVYGSSQAVSDALRTFSGGLMKTSPGNMLPYDNTTYFTTDQIAALNMANDANLVPTSSLFAAGDRRANENIELTAIQTLFLRNHNAIANRLHASHPGWTDEQLYQEARKLNIASYQNIVYNEWIPAVLGQNALASYTGYKPNVNATISTEFSTVAFRFGHSLLSAEIERQTNSGADISDVSPDGSTIDLAEAFFNPNLLNPTGAVDPLTGHSSSDIGPVLKAMADGVSQATDLLAVGDVRNLLFGPLGAGGEDLMARDVQRGRDDGIADYNTMRVALGLPAVTSFAQINSDPTIQAELAQAYPGGVNTIDAFEGGLAEAHVRGSDVGPLFQAIMVDQFTRLRDGDRFFYLNGSFNREEMNIIQQSNSLGEVISANAGVTNLQRDVFVFRASVSGTVTLTQPPPRSGAPLPPPSPMAGVAVQLLDDTGTIVATTTTDRNGRYIFTQLSGPSSSATTDSGLSATGTYRIAIIAPPGTRLGTGAQQTITISAGDTNLNGVDFGLTLVPRIGPQQPPPQGPIHR